MHKSHERALEALSRRGRHRALATAVGARFRLQRLSGARRLGAPCATPLRAAHRARRAGRGRRLAAAARKSSRARGARSRGGGVLRRRERAVFRRRLLGQRRHLLDAAAARRSHRARRADPRQRARRACAASKAERAEARHNDPQAFEDAIGDWRAAAARARRGSRSRASTAWTATARPLDELIAIADRHDGMLVIDEAHATGVFGPNGRGLGAEFEGRENVLTLAHLRQGARCHRGARSGARHAARVPGQPLPAVHLRDRAVAADGGAGARGARHLSRSSRTARAAARSSRSPLPAASSQPRAASPHRARRSSRSSSAPTRARCARRGPAGAWASTSARYGRRRCPRARRGCGMSLTLNVDEASGRRDVRGARAQLQGVGRMSARLRRHGTDTDIGKTVFAAGARRRARRLLLEAGAGRPRGRDRRARRCGASAGCPPIAFCRRPIG